MKRAIRNAGALLAAAVLADLPSHFSARSGSRLLQAVRAPEWVDVVAEGLAPGAGMQAAGAGRPQHWERAV
jgi:hypothetical protein